MEIYFKLKEERKTNQYLNHKNGDPDTCLLVLPDFPTTYFQYKVKVTAAILDGRVRNDTWLQSSRNKKISISIRASKDNKLPLKKCHIFTWYQLAKHYLYFAFQGDFF